MTEAELNQKLNALKTLAAELLGVSLAGFAAQRPDEFRAMAATAAEQGVSVRILPAPVVEIWAAEPGGARQVLVTIDMRQAPTDLRSLN